jgi:hypothetical protein
MTMSHQKLKLMVGFKIVDAILTAGDAGIAFENGISLAIYNEFCLTGFSGDEARRLIGNSVRHVDGNGEFISIYFEKGLSMQIDMRENSYAGPEAMQLRIPGKPTVIWN